MQNYISYPINLANVPVNVKKTFCFDDFLVENSITKKDCNEEFVKISENDDIHISPFWEEEDTIQLQDKELQSIIDLEGNLMYEYVKNNNFGIYVRKSVYNRLWEANNYFKQRGYQISVKIGYRPLEVQYQLLDKIKEYIQQKYPDLNIQEQYKIICEYISDPNNFTPPHSTGGAVDIQLLDSNKNPVDMGSSINYPGEESNITYSDFKKHQLENRWFLCNTMLSFGFANLVTEWWHFSYGDIIRAYFYGYSESLYSKN